MKPEQDFNYKELNRKSWNNRVEAHLDSDFYDMTSFLDGKSSLNRIELDLLGDLKGKRILHLQCHFGQDSISLAREGAIVTGVDLSDKAIKKAEELASQCHVKANFIHSDIYDLPNFLDESFDIVFTRYGVIPWFPDLNKWANIVARYLKPGGRFIFVEFHPVVWMFDEDFNKVEDSYFNSGPMLETEEGTYANRKAKIQQQSVVWNHSMSDIVNSLIRNGLHIQSLDEYDYSPYDCFKHTIEFEHKRFRIKHLNNKIPMILAIDAIKDNN